MHPDAGTWQALLDGELSPSVRAELEGHLAGCAACRESFGKLQFARDKMTARLGLLESRPPHRRAEVIRGRARTVGRPRLLAAGILLAFATAAGATIQSGVLHRLVGDGAGAKPTTQRSQAATGAQAERPSGIVLYPSSGLEVQFERPQREGVIRIVFADQPAVSIVASSSVPYSVERGRVAISNQRASASYRIMLPRTLSPVSVRVDRETVFSKRGATVETVTTAGPAGEYVIPLTRTGTSR